MTNRSPEPPAFGIALEAPVFGVARKSLDLGLKRFELGVARKPLGLGVALKPLGLGVARKPLGLGVALKSLDRGAALKPPDLSAAFKPPTLDLALKNSALQRAFRPPTLLDTVEESHVVSAAPSGGSKKPRGLADSEFVEEGRGLASDHFQSLSQELWLHDAGWAEMWDGAIYALEKRGADYPRHVASSLRALIWSVMDHYSPKQGKETDRQRFRRLLESRSQSDLAAAWADMSDRLIARLSSLDKRPPVPGRDATALVHATATTLLLILPD